MATGDRTKAIIGKAQLALAGMDAQKVGFIARNYPDSLMCDVMNDVARRLAEETLCIEAEDDISITVDSEANVPAGFYRGKLIVLPDGSDIQLVEVDVSTFDQLANRQFTFTGQSPTFYKTFNSVFSFYPEITTGTYTVYYYAVPTTTPSGSIDPETPAIMDKALEYGLVAEIAAMIGDGNKATIYTSKFEYEFQRVKNSYRRSKTVPNFITPRD